MIASGSGMSKPGPMGKSRRAVGLLFRFERLTLLGQETIRRGLGSNPGCYLHPINIATSTYAKIGVPYNCAASPRSPIVTRSSAGKSDSAPGFELTDMAKEHFEINLLARPGWKHDVQTLMAARETIVLGGWDFTLHHAYCAAIAEDFDYHYQWEPTQKRATFKPRTA